ncbi:unnamed protein product [Amoebophrya sp. A25]|nr:unnamed protein product [Amoebophrya sp. A25]|eukprot:GSA25T00019937001.1
MVALSVVRALRQKQKENETADEFRVVNDVEEEEQAELLDDNYADDDADEAFDLRQHISTILIKLTPPPPDELLDDDNAQQESRWLVTVRVDLKERDFSGVWCDVELDQEQGVYLQPRGGLLHSPQLHAHDCYDWAFELFKCRLGGAVVDDVPEVRLFLGAKIQTKKSKAQAAKARVLEADFKFASKCEQLLYEKKQCSTQAEVIKRQKQPAAAAVYHKKQKVAPHPRDKLLKEKQGGKPDAAEKTTIKKVEGVKASGSSPAKKMKEKLDSAADHKEQQARTRQKISRDISHLQTEGFVTKDGSSADTYKTKGRHADNLMCNVQPPYEKLCLECLRKRGPSFIVKGTTYAKRKFGLQEDCHVRSAELAALWAVRVRFILERVKPWLKSDDFRCVDKQKLVRDFEEATSPALETGQKSWANLVRDQKTTYTKCLTLDDWCLQHLDSGANNKEYEDWGQERATSSEEDADP